jgi:hypothetical protein
MTAVSQFMLMIFAAIPLFAADAGKELERKIDARKGEAIFNILEQVLPKRDVPGDGNNITAYLENFEVEVLEQMVNLAPHVIKRQENERDIGCFDYVNLLKEINEEVPECWRALFVDKLALAPQGNSFSERRQNIFCLVKNLNLIEKVLPRILPINTSTEGQKSLRLRLADYDPKDLAKIDAMAGVLIGAPDDGHVYYFLDYLDGILAALQRMPINFEKGFMDVMMNQVKDKSFADRQRISQSVLEDFQKKSPLITELLPSYLSAQGNEKDRVMMANELASYYSLVQLSRLKNLTSVFTGKPKSGRFAYFNFLEKIIRGVSEDKQEAFMQRAKSEKLEEKSFEEQKEWITQNIDAKT